MSTKADSDILAKYKQEVTQTFVAKTEGRALRAELDHLHMELSKYALMEE
jgi:hypothetical protein